jgi:glycosyltransferase involved in cell wall biosynthesis
MLKRRARSGEGSTVASRRLRILQVITPHRFAGAERVCAELSAALRARGHEVRVAAPPRVRAFADYLQQLGVPFLPAAIAGKLNLAAPRRLAALAKEMEADLLHAHLSSASLHACAARRFFPRPVVAHVHAMNRVWWYQGADVVVACSRGVAEHLCRQGLRPLVQVIYNGVRAQQLAHLPPPQDVRRALGLSPGAPVVGAVASLVPRKGHRYLLQALHLLKPRWPDLVCLLLGAGPLEAALRRLAARWGLAEGVRFLGFRANVWDFVQIMDVLVLPSLAIEGFGLCIVEAALLGVPAVASALPGVDEVVVDNQTGLLVPPGDATGLAQALARLLSDPTLRRRLGDQARRWAQERFAIERMAAEVEQLYENLLSSAGHAQAHPDLSRAGQ